EPQASSCRSLNKIGHVANQHPYRWQVWTYQRFAFPVAVIDTAPDKRFRTVVPLPCECVALSVSICSFGVEFGPFFAEMGWLRTRLRTRSERRVIWNACAAQHCFGAQRCFGSQRC